MTDVTGDLLTLCDELAEKFTTRARRNDSEASLPIENYADIREAGLMGLMIPENHDVSVANCYSSPTGNWYRPLQ